MTTNVNAADGGGGDTITLTLSGGRTMEMSESFARRLDSQMDDVSGGVDSSGRYSQDDALYDDVGQVIETLDRAGIEKYKGNRERLDSSAADYLVALSGKMSSQQRNALASDGDAEVGDGDNVKGYVDDFRNAFDAAMDKKYPGQSASNDSASSQTEGGSGDMDMSGVKGLLDEVKSSDNSSTKASKLSEAIEALIAQIRGGGASTGDTGSTGSDVGNDLKSDIDNLKNAIGGSSTGPAPDVDDGEETDPSVTPAPAPAPAPQITKLQGDDLMGRLDGGGGRVTFDESDMGIGIGDDEIGLGETMTFRPDAPASGGSVELVDLKADERGGQETATISVMKDGEEVDTITVRGDMDGDQTVQIDQAFDELVFKPGEGRNSDFAIKSITTETGGTTDPAAPPETGGPDTGGSGPIDGETPGAAPQPDAGTWSPSVEYNANDSLTVEVKNAEGEWVAIDTKGGGDGQGHGNLADIEAGETPEVRLVNNSTGQIIGMDDPQARVTTQDDGTIIVNFEDRENLDDDYDDAVVTLKPAAPQDADGPGPVTDGGAAEQAEFDATQLLELLQALSDTVSLIDGAEGLSEGDKQALFDKIADSVGSIATALDAEGEGGSGITSEEVAGILETVMGLTDSVEGSVNDSGSKNDVLDALAMGVGKVADEMA